MNKYLLKYEFLNTLYNFYAFFFGALFPVVLINILYTTIKVDVPESAWPELGSILFVRMSVLVVLAAIFMNHGGAYSNEIDKGIPDRLLLFGFSSKTLFLGKLFANLIFFTMCFGIYMVGTLPFIEIETPSFVAGIIFVVISYLLAVIFLALAHGIATLVRKFSFTYAIVMVCYFGIMILSGDMGIEPDRLPKGLQVVADLLPTKELSYGFTDFWLGKDYNFAPLIQSMIFLTGITAVLIFVANKKEKRLT